MSNVQLQLTHRERMSRYYEFHSKIYDATRWMFLFGRRQIIRDLVVRPGETVVEIGCGTGRNFRDLAIRLDGRGRLIGVDCSKPMLAQAERRIRHSGWSNVEVVDHEYGSFPLSSLTGGQADVVLFSYSLSMIPNWQQALKCAKAELKPGGRIGIVDFSPATGNNLHGPTRLFADWLRFNHVECDRPYESVLMSVFEARQFRRVRAFGGLWSYFRFAGVRNSLARLPLNRIEAEEPRQRSTPHHSHVCTRF